MPYHVENILHLIHFDKYISNFSNYLSESIIIINIFSSNLNILICDRHNRIYWFITCNQFIYSLKGILTDTTLLSS